MAHYAFIKDNIVTEVIVGKDESDTTPDGYTSWEEYYLSKRPDQDACKRTSYNTYGNAHKDSGTSFRGNFAGRGYTYDSANDVFIEPQPHASWICTENTNWLWEAPIAYPDDGNFYIWNDAAYQADTADPKTEGWELEE